MEPNLGQGAAQAIEDADALLVALRAGGELSGARAASCPARGPPTRRLGAHGLGRSRRSPRASPRLALSTHAGPRDLMGSFSAISVDCFRHRRVTVVVTVAGLLGLGLVGTVALAWTSTALEVRRSVVVGSPLP
jgi:hypothetical protein